MSLADEPLRPGTPIVWGCLFDVRAFSSSREQLVLEMTNDRRIVLMEGTRGGRAALLRPWPRVIDDEGGVLRVTNAFALSGRPKLHRFHKPLASVEGWALRLLLRRRGIRQYLIWLRTPGQGLYRGRGTNKYIYDCLDPSFVDDVDPVHDAAERADVRDASLVFATAHTLLARMQKWNPDPILLPNGTARAGAAPAVPPAAPLPLVVGYIGTLDARFDATAVRQAAEELPGWTFVIAGRVNNPDDTAVVDLLALPNVEVTGPIPEDEALGRLAGFGVGLIPFTPRPMNDAINSVKMFDYLAFGLPVVSMDTVESRNNEFVRIAATPSELAATIVEAHRSDSEQLRQARSVWAQANTWAVRSRQATQALRSAGLIDGHLLQGR